MTEHTTNCAIDLLRRLLVRGDSISVECGRLIIQPASGRPVPPDWLAKHSPALIRQILIAIGRDAYLYRSHGTGRYGPKNFQGLTLQFQSVITMRETHAIFNVELTRARTTATGAEGEPLPEGHFRISKKHQLYHCWLSTDLLVPKRLSALHDYMGKLRDILFSASLTKNRIDGRLDARTLLALNIPASVIRQTFLPENPRTMIGQAPDNTRTRMPDKETALAQQPQRLQPFLSTGGNIHGKAVIRKHGDTVVPFAQSSRKAPQEQTTEEWLADLEDR